MSDTPKSFRELAREMRDEARMCREKDYMASSIALDGQATRIEELADEWERYSQNEYCPAKYCNAEAMSESLVEKWERECAPMTNVAYVQALKDCARELKARDAKIRKIVEAIPCRCGAVAREGTRVVGRINPCAAHRILALLDGQPEEGKRG